MWVRIVPAASRVALLMTCAQVGITCTPAGGDCRQTASLRENARLNQDSDWHAGGGSFSGLYHIPTAQTVPEGLMRLAIADDRYRRVTLPAEWRSRRLYCLTMGFLPGLEIGAAAAETPLHLAGTFDDRLVSAKWQLLGRRDGLALALGSTDVEGTRMAGSEYAVLSLLGSLFSVHVGAGRGALKGFFAGAEAFPVRDVRVYLEYDSRDPNVGLGWRVNDRWQLSLALPQLHSAQLSLSYTLPAASRMEVAELSATGPVPATTAEPGTRQLQEALATEGFEDIQIALTGSDMCVRAESRVFLNPERALLVMADVAARLRPSHTRSVTAVLRRQQVDVVEMRRDISEGGEAEARFAAARRKAIPTGVCPQVSPSGRHVDVTIGPRVSASFGARRVPWRLTLQAEAEARPAAGWSLHAQAEAIATDSMDHRSGVSLRSLAVSHTSHPAPRTWVRLLAGRPAWHGPGVQTRVLWESERGDWVIEGHVAGFSSQRQAQSTWCAGMQLSCPSMFRNTVVSVGADRFAAGDAGVTVDILRRMGETEIALFAIRTGRRSDRAWIVGTRLGVPLGPSRTRWDSPVRVRPHDRFAVEYRTRTGALPEEGLAERIGLGPALFDVLLDRGRLMPASLRHRFDKSLP